jgi:carboxymethylenebutenolidase
MGAKIKLKATDGHEFGAYVAEPGAAARAAIVVIQEIFGVNGHIRSVADGYAKKGYCAIAPALFDRVERDLELSYTPEDSKRGMGVATKVGMENALLDVAAAIAHATGLSSGGKVGVVGFCWGGTLAWLSATRLSVAAAVGYYGGQIAKYAEEAPKCAVMLHFGEKDQNIPASETEKIQKAHPEVPIFLYDAGHGFNCDQRGSYEPKSAARARERSLGFFGRYL